MTTTQSHKASGQQKVPETTGNSVSFLDSPVFAPRSSAVVEKPGKMQNASPKRLQILHLEARREDSLQVRNVLESEGIACEILRVESSDELATSLRECRFDLLIADVFLADLQAAALGALVREMAHDLPLIFLVADSHSRIAQECRRTGLGEVVAKTNPARLITAVRNALVLSRMRSGQIFAEVSLTETEDRLRRIAEEQNQAFWSADFESGEVFFVSPGLERLVGLPPHLFAQRRLKLSELVHADDQEQLAEAMEVQARSGEAHLELRFLRADGGVCWVWTRLFPVFEKGHLGRVAGISEDITQQKATEAAIATQHFLTGSNPIAGIEKALSTLGEALGADRVVLIELECDSATGRTTIKAPAEWNKAGLSSSAAKTQLCGRTITEVELERWRQELAGGRNIASAVATLPAHERKWLEEGSVRSVLVVPVCIEGELAGWLEADACTSTRSWSADEQSILQTVAASLGCLLRACRHKSELSEARDRYKEIFENSIEGIFQTTPDGRYLTANPALARIQGYNSAAELIQQVGDLARDIYLNASDREEFKRRLERDGVVRNFEVPVRRRDGKIIWVSENARAVRDSAGQVKYYEGTLMDITERKQMEEALRDSELLHHSLVENLPVHIFRKDLEGRITFVNRRFCELLGREMTDIIGKTDYELFPRELADIYRQGDLHVMSTRTPLDSEEEQVSASGSRMHIHVIKSPIIDGKGNLVGIQGIFWDITGRRDAEHQLRQTNQRLAAALRQLKETQQTVVQQERLHALGQMASGIAHDFNNTLMAILGFTELLLTHPETLDNKAKVVSYLKTMSTAAKDAATVVKRLNEFYRHREEGEIFPPINLRKLAEQVIPLTQPKWKDQALASGVHIDVRTNLHEVLPVPGHEGELRECLINLIFNAVDAMPNGGTITLTTRMEGDAVALEVADTGSGMSEDVKKRCFEPFFSTKGQRGTGLGLSMVFGIIQRHQGTIDVQTEVGKGTCFVIKLPALKEVGNKGGDTELLGAPTQPLNILVADDEPLIRQILTEYLQIDGHTVTTAADGREALQRFAEKHFDLVLTDRSMPHLTGDSLADAVKQVDPKRPVVLLTGYGEMMKATGQKPKGVDVIMAKPITLNSLRLSLSEAIRAN